MSERLSMDPSLTQLHAYTDQQDIDHVKKVNAASLILLDQICQAIKPGVKESEIKAYCFELYEQCGVDRIWHQPYIRFGQHTVMTFHDKTDEDLTLQSEDIAFVDIGIVIDGMEGDVGRTLVFGDNAEYQALADYTEALFFEAADYWRANQVTGLELYDFVQQQATAHGYECPLQQAGHLIGQFSHAQTRWTKGLSHYPELVQPGCWVLEIQLKHKEKQFGGFYEQVLI